MVDEERLDWIERWCEGWRECIRAAVEKNPSTLYQFMALDVACSYALELVNYIKESE